MVSGPALDRSESNKCLRLCLRLSYMYQGLGLILASINQGKGPRARLREPDAELLTERGHRRREPAPQKA